MEIDEDLKAFLVESSESLNQLEVDLVALETHPTDPDLITRIYRHFHTLKGNGGFLGLNTLESITHAAENLLSRLREGQLTLSPEMTNGLLQVIDAVRVILTTLETTGEAREFDFTGLIETLAQLKSSDQIGAETKSSAAAELASLTSAVLHPSSIAESAIRVDVKLLDDLMNMVGELVLCRNQILEFANTQSDAYLTDTFQRLNLITNELQEGVMKTRMQPIRKLWSKFPRMVRDLARSLDKQVRLVMEGEDTKLDKTLLEAIADPFIHLIRNCIDHGIETASVRTAAGKPAEGQLLLRAAHESGYVNIEISDDGAGIHPDQLKQKAIKSRLITPEQADRMTDQEALKLIFLPGLSTTEQVTHVSGRGIGMDVVRTNIEKIGGAVDVQSQLGQGAAFKLKIPLTLAIAPTLIVTCGGERYAIPQVSLLELVRLEGEPAQQGVEQVHGALVYRLRGNLLPLVYLTDALQLKQAASASNGGPTAEPEDILNIVVLQAVDKSFGLVVDAINDTQEIVVKPLGKQLKGITCFAGATIMGDGRVTLILDIQGLAQRTHMVSEQQEAAVRATSDQTSTQAAQTQPLLLFQGPDKRRMGIRLTGVARLEQFAWEAIERVGHQEVIQYRDQILPLIDLSAVFGQSAATQPALEGEPLQVVVVISTKAQNTDDQTMFGLVVEQIQDIIDEPILIKGPATQSGVECSAVVQGKVTEILDVEAIAQTVQFVSPQRPVAV